MFARTVFSKVLRNPGPTKLAVASYLCRNINSTSKVLSSGTSFRYILKQNNISDDEKSKIEAEAKEMYKDWIPFGWNDYDKLDDVAKYKTITFLLMSGFTFGLVYLFWYRPRGLEADWARREAFLELERRQKLGLPLVDPNLIPPERVRLPTKEELGPDFKIVI